jgi:RNA polymerase sigma-70 factor (ECF subfamily)
MPDRKELQELSGDGRINPEGYAIRSQQASRLREAIQRLPSQYRIVLVLRDMEGLTDDEVAEITGLRPGTVRVRLHRARLFVRKELMSAWEPRKLKVADSKPASQASFRPAKCKEMFAELSNYLDDQLDDSMCEELQKHIGGCEPCKAFLASLEAAIQVCRKAPPECPRKKEVAKLHRALMRKYKRALTAVQPVS